MFESKPDMYQPDDEKLDQALKQLHPKYYISVLGLKHPDGTPHHVLMLPLSRS